MDIQKTITDSPATGYILSFGGLGILIALALNSLHKMFKMPERAWGFTILAVGALGGYLIQELGLVTLPGAHTFNGHLLACLIGAAVASAAAGYSAVDLRAAFKLPVRKGKK